MKGLRSIRPLPKDSLRGVDPTSLGKKLPKFVWVEPTSLYVEESYQRSISGSGIRLIRKIYATFSWLRYQVPVCVRVQESGNVLVCIDGQHTATATACRPDILKIPVMVVDAADVPERAAAFVGKNRDRIGLTAWAIYHAELASGDPQTVGIARALKAAGASIVRKNINTRDPHPPGTTIAVGSIRAVAKKYGEELLTRVLTILTKAKRGPIKGDEIAAATLLLLALDDPSKDRRVQSVVESKDAQGWSAAAVTACVGTEEQLPSALARLWAKELGVVLDAAETKRGKGQINPGKKMITGGATLKVRAPEAAPAVEKAAPPPEQKPVPTFSLPVSNVVERNGIIVDLDLAQVCHRGKKLDLSAEETALLGALARVMPAMLVNNDLARKVWGNAIDSTSRLDDLVRDLNPELARVDLKVNTIPKMGRTLTTV